MKVVYLELERQAGKMSIDRVSNMLSMLKNACMAKNPFVEVIYTKQNENISNVLKDKGFLTQVKTFKPKGKSFKMLHLDIAYENGNPVLTDVKRISKPGHRKYVSYKDIKRVAAGYGMQIVSTSRGVLNGDIAKKQKLGGEIICEVR